MRRSVLTGAGRVRVGVCGAGELGAVPGRVKAPVRATCERRAARPGSASWPGWCAWSRRPES